VQPGDVLAKIPRETTKTKDITGGLPRVVELFETRKPRDPAVISEIDGVVKYGEISKGQRKIYVESEDGKTQKEYSIPRGVHINVQEGEHVKAGEPLIDGPLNPHDIAGRPRRKVHAGYLVNSIQEVYRLQGVNINDKHIEVIVRQMMRWVKVEDVGDTTFLLDEQVDKFRFREENDRAIAEGGRPRPDVRCCSASPRRRSRPIRSSRPPASRRPRASSPKPPSPGKVDYLRGLKENVIMGRLIPAGTGLERYRNIELLTECLRLLPSKSFLKRQNSPLRTRPPASTSSVAARKPMLKPTPPRRARTNSPPASFRLTFLNSKTAPRFCPRRRFPFLSAIIAAPPVTISPQPVGAGEHQVPLPPYLLAALPPPFLRWFQMIHIARPVPCDS
jgi:hypothetical protein